MKRLPQLRSLPVRQPRGPRELQALTRTKVNSPFANPPDGFLMGTNSKYEWQVYLGLAIYFQNPADAFKPPFFGGSPDWVYQKAMLGGRRQKGGAVVDFLVFPYQQRPIGIRVVTEAWHLYASSAKKGVDTIQLYNLSDDIDMVDLYDTEFAWDESGQAVMVALKRILGQVQAVNPMIAGTLMRASRMQRGPS